MHPIIYFVVINAVLAFIYAAPGLMEAVVMAGVFCLVALLVGALICTSSYIVFKMPHDDRMLLAAVISVAYIAGINVAWVACMVGENQQSSAIPMVARVSDVILPILWSWPLAKLCSRPNSQPVA